jgi:hypothetical protein
MGMLLSDDIPLSTLPSFTLSTVSSPKSVSEFGFREIAETVTQVDLNGFPGPKTIGFSGGQFHFVVEPLDSTRGKHPFCAKPVENQFSMLA